MVQQLEAGNRASAAGWKQQLDKYYKETSVYPEAIAYYQGNKDQMRLARAQAERERRERRERAQAERLARAQALADEEKIAEIKQEQAEAKQEEVAQAQEVATGDAGKADAYFNQATEIYAKAQSLGVTEERDQLYAKAEKEFNKAMRLYEKLGMDVEMVKANQYRYACIKYRRF
jgi:hypothetical protein